VNTRPGVAAPVPGITRRKLLKLSAAALLESSAPLFAARAAAAPETRSLSLVHTHVDESLSIDYFSNGAYVPEALARLNHLLRDFRTGEVHRIDPPLFDILYDLRALAGGAAPYEIISCYRSPRTNAELRDRSSAVAEHSLHMEGKAIDVRIRGFDTRKLRDLALSMHRGGVGYYEKSDFVHVDTGRVRAW
jgi:uncharacterized protein YcbK (DUF882 family)